MASRDRAGESALALMDLEDILRQDFSALALGVRRQGGEALICIFNLHNASGVCKAGMSGLSTTNRRCYSTVSPEVITCNDTARIRIAFWPKV